jgi:hypothetical protein
MSKEKIQESADKEQKSFDSGKEILLRLINTQTRRQNETSFGVQFPFGKIGKKTPVTPIIIEKKI